VNPVNPVNIDQTPAAAIAATESPAEGLRVAGDILRRATSARWPMYLRNVKQILRQADSGFDERRFGFGGLMDLLRGLQREGIVRLERDRRGGRRVFQGAALQRPPIAAEAADRPREEPQPAGDLAYEVDMTDESGGDIVAIEVQPGEVVEIREPAETEQPEVEPIPVDTTAELLGRAKPKRPSVRATGHARWRKPAAAPRKTTPRRARTKKPSAEAADSRDKS